VAYNLEQGALASELIVGVAMNWTWGRIEQALSLFVGVFHA